MSGKVSVKVLGAGSFARMVKGKAQRTRGAVSLAIVRLWQSRVEASSVLSGRAKARYKGFITPYAEPKTGAYIKDRITLLLEHGWKAFDMKPGLLSGRAHRFIPLGGKRGKLSDGRTVSVSSGGWKHPGYRGAKLESGVKRSIPKLVREILTKAMKQ